MKHEKTWDGTTNDCLSCTSCPFSCNIPIDKWHEICHHSAVLLSPTEYDYSRFTWNKFCLAVRPGDCLSWTFCLLSCKIPIGKWYHEIYITSLCFCPTRLLIEFKGNQFCVLHSDQEGLHASCSTVSLPLSMIIFNSHFLRSWSFKWQGTLFQTT